MATTLTAPESVARRAGTRAARVALALGVATAIVVAARIAGLVVDRHADLTHIGAAYPLAGGWRDGVSPWLAVPVLAGAAIWWGWPRLADRLGWRPLLAAATLVAALWTVALALADGPRGFTYPLAPWQQYPHDVPRVHDLGRYLGTFNDHVLGTDGTQWTVHVAGHPPGALGVFVLLDRVGLGGLGWAAVLCVAGGALAVPCVLVVTRHFAGTGFARRAALLVPVAPAALWVASSADALFAGVAAAGLCALTLAAGYRGRGAASPPAPLVDAADRPASRGRDEAGPVPGGRPGSIRWSGWRGDLLAAAGGLALGCCLFLSYGLALLVLPALGVVLVQRRVRPLLIGGAVVLALLAGGWLAGFDWWQGLGLAAQRTRGGQAWQDRPTWYFLLANPADLAICVGPATVAGLALVRRARLAVLPLTVGLAVLAALVSNLSKGEVERIYLPFAVWLLPFAATLRASPRAARILVAGQLGWAVLITASVRTWW